MALPPGDVIAKGTFRRIVWPFAVVETLVWACYYYSFPALLPTWDYIDWMKIRKTTTVKNPFTGDKIPMRTIFSIYAIFMTALILRYGWRFVDVLRNGPPDEDHEIPGHEPGPPAIRHGEDVA